MNTHKRMMTGLAAGLLATAAQAQAFSARAEYMKIDLSGGPGAARYPVSYTDEPPDLDFDTCRTKELWLRLIPAGTFTMGSPEHEPGRGGDETQHEVTLSQPFYIGIFQVTQDQYGRVMGTNPAELKGETRPVEKVSYARLRGMSAGERWPADNGVDADSFFGKLRARTATLADLPTEAQWEYACRAGTATALNSGKDLTSDGICPNMAEVGRYENNCGWKGWGGNDTPKPFDGKGRYEQHTKVGLYKPNAWGLYDMHGNVSEWCLDWRGDYGTAAVKDPKGATSGDGRILRGGSWVDGNPAGCRSARRHSQGTDNIDFADGFRIAVLPGTAQAAQAQAKASAAQAASARGVPGRYVRVDIPKEQATLALAEVEVFSDGVNVALKGRASQCSTAWSGEASRAIDGNRDSHWDNNSISHTEENIKNPWWEVDLGDTKTIDKVVLWNRGDDFGHRLNHARVMILDKGRNTRWTGQIGEARLENTLEVKETKEADSGADEELAAACAPFKAVWGPYAAGAEKIRTEVEPKVDALRQQYKRSLETLKATVQGRGDLEKTKAVAAEIGRFAEDQGVPPVPDANEIAEIKALQATYLKSFTVLEKDRVSRLGVLTQKYVQALEQVQAGLVKADKLDDATAVSEAKERAKRTVDELLKLFEALTKPAPAGAAAAAKPAPAGNRGLSPAAGATPAGDSADVKVQKALAPKIEEAKRQLADMKKRDEYVRAIVALYPDTEDPRDQGTVNYKCYHIAGGGYTGGGSIPFRAAFTRLEIIPASGGKRRIVLNPGPPYETVEREVELKEDEVTNLGRIVFRKVKADGKADLHGTVRDEDGEPVPGVKVSAGASKSAMTDKDGNYRLAGFGLEIVTLKAEKKGYIEGGARVEIRDMDNREIQQDFKLFRPKTVVLKYVISAPNSESFTGNGIAQGTLKLTVNAERLSLQEVKVPSSSLSEFILDTRLRLANEPRGFVFSHFMAPIYYEWFGADVPFDSIEKAEEGVYNKQSCLPLEKGCTVVIRGFRKAGEKGVSKYCVKFFVEELSGLGTP